MSSAGNEPAPIWLQPPRPTRGPRPNLNREEITRAAIELADQEGLHAVSMRRIAAKLGSAATSLYWYVSRKEDLYELMADALIGEIPLPEHPSGDWRADLRTIATQTCAVLSRHPWFPLLGIQPGLGPNAQAYGRAAGVPLAELGLEPSEWINMLAALNNYIFGFVHRATAWQRLQHLSGVDEADWHARLQSVIDRTSEQDPTLAEQAAIRTELSGPESFQYGLELVFDGIAARLRAHQRQA